MSACLNLAQLPHKMTHNHQPEMGEPAAIRIKEAQTARNACPHWILAQHGVPTSVGTRIWTQLQLLLPHHTHHILKNHQCNQHGPLGATYTDIVRHPAGKVDTLRLVGATITIVYINNKEMRFMARSGDRQDPFLPDPQWPARRIFQAYLCTCPGKAGRTMPGPKDNQCGVQSLRTPAPLILPEGARGPQRWCHEGEGAHTVRRRLHTTHHPAPTGTNELPAPYSSTTPPGPSPNTTLRRPTCHRSDTMTKAYHARAGTAVRHPSTLHGPYCTSSPPTITPEPPPSLLTSRHCSPPGFTQYLWATQSTWPRVEHPRQNGH